MDSLALADDLDFSSVLDDGDDGMEASPTDGAPQDEATEEEEAHSANGGRKDNVQKRINALHAQKMDAKREAERLSKENGELRKYMDEISSWVNSISGDEDENFSPAPSNPQSNPRAPAGTFTHDDVAKMVRQELDDVTKNQREVYQLAQAWQPLVDRVKGASGNSKFKDNFLPWFHDYTEDVDTNGQKRSLLNAAKALKYAPETLYALGNHKGFDELPLEKQLELMISAHEKIRGSKDKITASDEPIERISGMRSGVHKSPSDMTPDEFYKYKMSRKK